MEYDELKKLALANIGSLDEVQKGDEKTAEEIEKLMMEHGDGFVNVQRKEEILERMKSGESRYFVFRGRDGGLLGAVEYFAEEGKIRGLVVSRVYRKIGIGELLIDKVVEVAVNDHLDVWVRKENAPSLCMFLKRGFIPVEMGERSLRLRRVLRK